MLVAHQMQSVYEPLLVRHSSFDIWNLEDSKKTETENQTFEYLTIYQYRILDTSIYADQY